ncbi:uncharacterized protein LOC123518713 [Portunus trituberculatus]|uniref:uncharacterized protein LOC123518713 n=1 Tax=Portunus trituberculatus TaxID=210409 RepID=UPI001E1CDD58|nr:uncharacterized protein LOC123518713 [Portunus trituberculatus]
MEKKQDEEEDDGKEESDGGGKDDKKNEEKDEDDEREHRRGQLTYKNNKGNMTYVLELEQCGITPMSPTKQARKMHQWRPSSDLAETQRQGIIKLHNEARMHTPPSSPAIPESPSRPPPSPTLPPPLQTTYTRTGPKQKSLSVTLQLVST